MTAEIIFIGTSSALIEPKRYHSSFIIMHDQFRFLVDAGDGVSKALFASGIHFNFIDAILITHRHADHWSGLPLLLTQWKLKRRAAPLSVYAHRSDINHIKRFLHDSYLYKERLPFKIEYIPITTGFSYTPADGLAFTAFRNSHLDKFRKSAAAGDTGFFSGSFLFTTGGKKVYYTGDIGSEDDLYLCNEQPDIYITECSHVSEKELSRLVKTIKPGMIIMTHYSNEQLSELIAVIDANPDCKMLLATEGMNVAIADKSISLKENYYYV
ncbi:MAG: hypothetical protein AMXMBFR48_16820 [Ignavibacteriales bacterium]